MNRKDKLSRCSSIYVKKVSTLPHKRVYAHRQGVLQRVICFDAQRKFRMKIRNDLRLHRASSGLTVAQTDWAKRAVENLIQWSDDPRRTSPSVVDRIWTIRSSTWLAFTVCWFAFLFQMRDSPSLIQQILSYVFEQVSATFGSYNLLKDVKLDLSTDQASIPNILETDVLDSSNIIHCFYYHSASINRTCKVGHQESARRPSDSSQWRLWSSIFVSFNWPWKEDDLKWMLLHADIFRAPPRIMLLCSLIGIGHQLAVTTLVLAAASFLKAIK